MYEELQKYGKYLGSARIHTYSYYTRCLTTSLPLLLFYYEVNSTAQIIPINSENDYEFYRKSFTDAITISWWAVPSDWFSRNYKATSPECSNSSINPIL